MPIASGLEFVILPALPATDPDNPGAPNLFLRTFDVAAIADGGLVVTWDTDEGDAIGVDEFAQLRLHADRGDRRRQASAREIASGLDERMRQPAAAADAPDISISSEQRIS